MKEKFLNKINMAKITVSSFAMMTMFPMVSFATTTTATDLSGLVETLLGYVFSMFSALGVFFAAFGIAQVIMAMKSDNGERKDQGTKEVLAGILLFAFGMSGSAFFVDFIVSLLSFS